MARYTGSVCRLCRREGQKLFLKGDRCYREKQKVRRVYGVQEKQFRNYFGKAERKGGVAGENLLTMLETRLDNVVYRMGLAASRVEARQLVRHGHYTVNGRKVNIPSFIVRVGDEIAVREKSKESAKFAAIAEALPHRNDPGWNVSMW